jgi:hypothetical protein
MILPDLLGRIGASGTSSADALRLSTSPSITESSWRLLMCVVGIDIGTKSEAL